MHSKGKGKEKEVPTSLSSKNNINYSEKDTDLKDEMANKEWQGVAGKLSPVLSSPTKPSPTKGISSSSSQTKENEVANEDWLVYCIESMYIYDHTSSPPLLHPSPQYPPPLPPLPPSPPPPPSPPSPPRTYHSCGCQKKWRLPEPANDDVTISDDE